jgi:predicted thioesterase
MRRPAIIALIATGLVATGGGAPAQQQPSVAVTRTESLTGTVESVNLRSREVALRNEGGGLVTVVVGLEARNLAQLRPGDRVAIEAL